MKSIFTDDLKEELKKTFMSLHALGHRSDTQISKLLGVSPAAVGTWRRLEKAPSYEHLQKLRDLASGKTEEVKNILHLTLSPEAMKAIREFAEMDHRPPENAAEYLILLAAGKIKTMTESEKRLNQRMNTLYKIEKLEHSTDGIKKK